MSEEAPHGLQVIVGDFFGLRLYTGAMDGCGRLLLRFHRAAEFVLELGDEHVGGALDPRTTDELGGLIVGGTVLAAWMELRGELVLHAGAVEHRGRAIAVVGASGMGKSTLCAWLCRAGAVFVSDDVLRVEQGNGCPRCYRGPGEARLREGASTLAAKIGALSRQTVDGKTAISPARSLADTLPLGALLIPVPDRVASRVEVKKLHGRAALLALSSFPRVLGWKDADVLRKRFGSLAQLVADVPVYRATVPWGPPFRPETALELLDALDL